MRYFVKTPWWLKKIYPDRLWNVDTKEKIIYLSFDDGPHPVATPFVLEQLKNYGAKASFFCIGKNVQDYPGIYERILREGHQAGNHTQHHLNGWNTDSETYLQDVAEAAQYINSPLFRPPYGRIKRRQAKGIPAAIRNTYAKIVMWDVLSADFDQSISKEKCLENVMANAQPGSIVLFHDSQKALANLSYALPAMLKFFTEQGYIFRTLTG